MSAHLRDDLAFDGCGPPDDVLDVVDVCGKAARASGSVRRHGR